MRGKKYKTVCGIISWIGLCIVLGAASGSDAGTLTIFQSFWMVAIGIVLFVGGGYMGGYIE